MRAGPAPVVPQKSSPPAAAISGTACDNGRICPCGCERAGSERALGQLLPPAPGAPSTRRAAVKTAARPLVAPDHWNSSPRAFATFSAPCPPHMTRPNLFLKSAQPSRLHVRRDASASTGAPCFCLPRCWNTCAGMSCATLRHMDHSPAYRRNSPFFRPTGPRMKKRSTPHGGACHGGRCPAKTPPPAADFHQASPLPARTRNPCPTDRPPYPAFWPDIAPSRYCAIIALYKNIQILLQDHARALYNSLLRMHNFQ